MSEPGDGPAERSYGLRRLANGEFESSYIGPRTEGEGNGAEVAGLVIALLRDNGGEWSGPRPADGQEEGVDWVADGPNGPLRMQITRIPHDPGHWKALSGNGHTAGAFEYDAAAGDMIAAIRRKAAKFEPARRPEIVLVLDASLDLRYGLPPTLVAFHDRCCAEVERLGFFDVLLVHPMGINSLLRVPDPTVWFRMPGSDD